jgi:hypothetical protein
MFRRRRQHSGPVPAFGARVLSVSCDEDDGAGRRRAEARERAWRDLRARLPESGDPEIRRITDVLGPVFDHHALMLSSSLDMLAVDWRSERIRAELERIDGLGAPAERLEGVRAALVSRRAPGGPAGAAGAGSDTCSTAAAG